MNVMNSRAAPIRPRLSDVRLDRSAYEFGTLHDEGDRAYWLARSPDERLEALELLRQINYGEDAATARLQRVFEFAELGAG